MRGKFSLVLVGLWTLLEVTACGDDSPDDTGQPAGGRAGAANGGDAGTGQASGGTGGSGGAPAGGYGAEAGATTTLGGTTSTGGNAATGGAQVGATAGTGGGEADGGVAGSSQPIGGGGAIGIGGSTAPGGNAGSSGAAGDSANSGGAGGDGAGGDGAGGDATTGSCLEEATYQVPYTTTICSSVDNASCGQPLQCYQLDLTATVKVERVASGWQLVLTKLTDDSPFNDRPYAVSYDNGSAWGLTIENSNLGCPAWYPDSGFGGLDLNFDCRGRRLTFTFHCQNDFTNNCAGPDYTEDAQGNVRVLPD